MKTYYSRILIGSLLHNYSCTKVIWSLFILDIFNVLSPSSHRQTFFNTGSKTNINYSTIRTAAITEIVLAYCEDLILHINNYDISKIEIILILSMNYKISIAKDASHIT